MKQRLSQRIISFGTAVLIVFHSLTPIVVPWSTIGRVQAQEASKESHVVQNEATPTLTPTPSEQTESQPTSTPTPVPTVIPTADEPTPTETQVEGASTEQTPSTSPPTVETEVAEQGELSVTIVQNTKAETLDLASVDTSSAQLSTDKGDYAPTDTVVVTGSILTPNQDYTLLISSSDPPAVTYTTQVTTDSQGVFIASYQLDGTYRPNYTAYLKDALGAVVATIAFTDGSSSSITTVNVTDLTPDTTTPGTLKVPIMTFTLRSTSAGEKFKKVKVQYTTPGTNEDDVSTAYLYRESDTSGGTFNSSTDIQMASDSSPSGGGEFDLNPTDYNMTAGTDYQFYIAVDVASGATLGNKVDAKIKKDKIDLQSGDWPNTADEALFDPSGGTTIVAPDTTSPTTPGIPSTTTPTADTTPTWNWTAATDNVGIDHYIFYWDTVAGGEANSSGSLSSATLSYTHGLALGQGTWYGKVRTFDAAGNSATSSNGTVTIDTTPPNTTLASFTPDPTSDNTPVYTGTAQDAPSVAIASVEYRVDSGNWQPATASDGAFDEMNEDFTFTTPALSDGAHTIETRATDIAGNTETSHASDTLTVDTMAPAVSAGPDQLKNALFSQVGSATDTLSDIASVLWSQQAGPGSVTFGSPSLATTDVTSDTDGTYTLRLTATDQAGNSAFDEFTLEWDTTLPTTPGIPTTTTPTNSLTQLWDWVASTDLNGILQYAWRVPGGPDGSVLGSSVTTNLGEGLWSLFVKALDNAGNESTESEGTVSVDTTLPTLQSATTQDQNRNGKIDSVKLTFSEAIDDSRLSVGAPDGWDVEGYDGEAIGSGDGENDSELVLTFSEGANADTALTPTISYTPTGGQESTHDIAGNELTEVSVGSTDGAAPVLLTAETRDSDTNGHIDRILATFSEELDDDSFDSGAFSVSGYNVTGGFQSDPGVASLDLEENSFNDTGARPTVSIDEGQLIDLQENGNVEGEVDAKDGAAPVSTIDGPARDSIHNSPIELSGSSSDGQGDTVSYTKLFFKNSNSENGWTQIDESQRDNENEDEPYEWSFTWTPEEDGTYDIKAEATDDAGNSENSPTVTGIIYDTTAPGTPSATPVAGDYLTDQSVTLSSSDDTSGLASMYYTTDGTTPSSTNGTLYETPIAVTQDTTLKAIAYDNAGNASNVLTAQYGIAPVISSETATTVTTTSTTITWTTDDPATSRVIYDTVPHVELGAAPNYGYASSTVETDTTPKVTSHSVVISGLTSGTTYYFRTISHGSPEAVGSQKSFATTSPSSSGGDGGTGGSSSTTGTAASAPVCSDAKPGSAPKLTGAVSGVNSVTLSWSSANSPVTYYLVTYGTATGAQTYGNPNVGGVGTSGYTVSNLSGGTTYYFRVRAGNGCMPGDYSNELSATPRGEFATGVATGFSPGVLGASTEEKNAVTQVTPTPKNEAVTGDMVGEKTKEGNGMRWILGIIFGGIGAFGIFFFMRRRKEKSH